MATMSARSFIAATFRISTDSRRRNSSLVVIHARVSRKADGAIQKIQSITFTKQFDRAIRFISPKAFVVENVNGMAYGDNRQLLDNQLRRYRLAGYRVKWQVLNAQDHGVAQDRRRVFIVGVRSDLDFEYDFSETEIWELMQVRNWITQKDVLNGMPEWPVGEFNEEPFHWYYLSRRRRRDWDETSPCIVGHWRHVPLHPMSPSLKRIHTDKWIFSRKGPGAQICISRVRRVARFSKKIYLEKRNCPRPLSDDWKRSATAVI